MSDPTPPEAFHSSPSPKATGILHYRFHNIPVVPVLGVSALAIAGILLYRRSKGAAGSAAATTTTTDSTAADDTVAGSTTDGYANLGGGASYDGTDAEVTGNGLTAGTTTSVATTNTAWGINAINYLVGEQQYSALDIQGAISNALSGKALSPLQEQIYNNAVSALGEPPQGVTSTLEGQGTATVTSGYHPYTTKKGDSIGSIVQATYGQVDSAILADFYKVNTQVKNLNNETVDAAHSHPSDELKVGQSIHLPIFTAGTLP